MVTPSTPAAPRRLPRARPPLPGFAGYRRASLPAAHSDGAEEALPSSQDDHPPVQRPIRRGVPRRPLPDPRHLPWPSPSTNRLGTPSSRPKAAALTTLAQASLALQTGRSRPPRFAPGLSTTHGGIATRDPGVSPDRTHTGRPPRLVARLRHDRLRSFTAPEQSGRTRREAALLTELLQVVRGESAAGAAGRGPQASESRSCGSTRGNDVNDEFAGAGRSGISRHPREEQR